MSRAMHNRKSHCTAGTQRLAAAIALLLLPAALSQAQAACRELLDVLRQHHVPVDTTVVDRAALDGILMAIDPGGFVIPAENARMMDQGATIAGTESWAEGIRYLRIKGVFDDAGTALTEQLAHWQQDSNALDGLVIDLRGAAGNSLTGAQDAAGALLGPNVPIYRLRDGAGTLVGAGTSSGSSSVATNPPLPILVAVDGKTRGVSVLLAGILKRHEHALLIGTPTAGDTAVRECLPLPGEALAAYTATRWFIPPEGIDDNAWKQGISPDIVITNQSGYVPPEKRARTGAEKPLSEKAKADRELMARVAADPVLAHATDILLGLRAVRGFLAPPDEAAPSAPEDSPPDDSEQPAPPGKDDEQPGAQDPGEP